MPNHNLNETNDNFQEKTQMTHLENEIQDKLTLKNNNNASSSSSSSDDDDEECEMNLYKQFNFDNDPVEDDEKIPGIKFVNYKDESQLDSVMRLVGKDLSEPYSGKCFERVATSSFDLILYLIFNI